MTDSTSDRPFAIWRVFHDAPRWWFARGCPPTVRDLRGWPRALHLTVLIAAMGLVAAVIGACILVMAQVRPPWDGVMFGLIFSVVVLVPLSRWLGRAWWWTLLAVPFTIAWFRLVDAAGQVWMSRIQTNGYPHELFMGVGLFLMTAGPGLWVSSWQRRHTW